MVRPAWSMSAARPKPGGLPYRFLLKAAIPLGFGLLLLQGIADICRHLAILLDNSVNGDET